MSALKAKITLEIKIKSLCLCLNSARTISSGFASFLYPNIAHTLKISCLNL